MKFTTTKMAEQYVQNMYNKPAKEATVKNDKTAKNVIPGKKEEDAATEE